MQILIKIPILTDSDYLNNQNPNTIGASYKPISNLTWFKTLYEISHIFSLNSLIYLFWYTCLTWIQVSSNMKDCKLIININKSAKEIFNFVLDPKNTPLWIDSIVKEEVNETPPRVGTVYRNVNMHGVWSEYHVTHYEENKVFEFVAADKNYHVRYTFTPLTDSSCELEYFEWVIIGELEAPFTIQILEKLKEIIEK